MGLARLLGIVMVALFSFVGCLEGQGESVAEGGEADEPLLEGVELATAPVTAERMDLALCRDLDQREVRCGGVPLDVAACADRFACSRQLWRQDVQPAVYSCLRDSSCDDDEPAMSCLEQVAAELEPSAAQLRFERDLADVEERCGALVDVAPGQSDLVYDALGFCLTVGDGCDAAAACTVATLEALMAEVCGARNTI